MTRTTPLAIALAIATALSLPALAQTTAPGGASTAPNAGGAGSTMAAPPPDTMASPSAGTPASGAANLNKTDRAFVTKAAAGGMAEVQAAQTAQQKSQNDQVKAFAQKMIDDHTPNNKELMDLASQKGLTPPAAVPARMQKQLDKLQAMDGSRFDRAYLQQQVKAHKQMLATFKNEAQDGKDPDLKAFASKTIPVIQSHIDMAQQDISGGKGAM
jgi:putative membrane protein